MKNGIYLLVSVVLIAFFVMISDSKNLLPTGVNVALLIVSALLLFAYLFLKYKNKNKRKK